MSSIIKSDNGVSSGVTGIVQTADSSGQLALQTTTSGGSAVTALTIDNSQKVTFANSIAFGSNAGITFNNSSALTNSTLNDYETGTWTPVVKGDGTAGTFTYSTQQGKYTKVGNVVTLTCSITITAVSGSPTGNLIITGIPFATSGSTNPVGAGQFQYVGLTNAVSVTPDTRGSASSLYIVSQTALGASQVAPVSGVQNGTIIDFSISYQATF